MYKNNNIEFYYLFKLSLIAVSLAMKAQTIQKQLRKFEKTTYFKFEFVQKSRNDIILCNFQTLNISNLLLK